MMDRPKPPVDSRRVQKPAPARSLGNQVFLEIEKRKKGENGLHSEQGGCLGLEFFGGKLCDIVE